MARGDRSASALPDREAATSAPLAQWEAFEPVDVYELTDLDQLRAAATPLRIRILGWLQERPRTVQEVGRLLGDRSTRLYYHVAELERVGLVKLVGTVARAGTVEKYYRAVARYFRLPPALLQAAGDTQGGKAWVEFVSGCLSATSRDLRRSYRRGMVQRYPDTVDVRHLVANLPPEAARTVATALRSLGELFTLLHRDAEPLRYGLLLALYPEAELDGRATTAREGEPKVGSEESGSEAQEAEGFPATPANPTVQILSKPSAAGQLPG